MIVVQLLANGLLQQLVQPFAMGAALGIHPLAVLIVTIAGGALFGMVGLVLAAPLTSAVVRISADLSPRSRRRGRSRGRARTAAQSPSRPPADRLDRLDPVVWKTGVRTASSVPGALPQFTDRRLDPRQGNLDPLRRPARGRAR